MNSTFGDYKLEIVSIEEVKNVELQSIYEQAKRQIEKQTSLLDGNEMMLYHGAKGKYVYILYKNYMSSGGTLFQ